MTIGRRGFLLAGGAVAGAGMLPVSEAMAAPVVGGRSVTDFGVEPNKEADQKAVLQQAILEISKSGNAVFMPAGSYLVSDWLELPPVCSIIGEAGLTRLSTRKIGGSALLAVKNQDLHLSGLMLDGHENKPVMSSHMMSLVMINGGAVSVTDCRFINVTGVAFSAANVEGFITTSKFVDIEGGALYINKARGLTISQLNFERCNTSVAAEGAINVDGEGVTISGSNVFQCRTGIALQGSGVVSGNYVSAQEYGLRLGGGGQETAAIMATGNNIAGCDIGMMVNAGGETIFASLNLITHAKSAAIRAFDGSKLVGPDLARESAESYLNLTVAGNVVR